MTKNQLKNFYKIYKYFNDKCGKILLSEKDYDYLLYEDILWQELFSRSCDYYSDNNKNIRWSASQKPGHIIISFDGIKENEEIELEKGDKYLKMIGFI